MRKTFLIVLAVVIFSALVMAETATQAGPYLSLNAKTSSTVKGSVSFEKLTSVGNLNGNTTYQMLSATAGTKVKNLFVVGESTLGSTGAITVTLPITATAGTKITIFLNAASGVSPTTSAVLSTSTFSITGVPSTKVDYLVIGR